MTPTGTYIQLPAPTFAQFDRWLWRNGWIRAHSGGYVSMKGEGLKTVEELEKMFRAQLG